MLTLRISGVETLMFLRRLMAFKPRIIYEMRLLNSAA